MGTPDPAFSVGRILAVMLREQYPEQEFEVVNAAMTAINSHVVLEIARDCAAHDPDLFVVYMGNNEVVGPYGPGTVFQNGSPNRWAIRAGLALKATRFGQLFGDVAAKVRPDLRTPDPWRGMQMFMDNPVTDDDPRLSAVYRNYRKNLSDICDIAQRSHAPLVLSTVAVNLQDCPPFASQHRSELSPDDISQWQSFYTAGVELTALEHWNDAIGQFEAAARIDDRFADLRFRLGQCMMAAGRLTEAQDQFERARDLDVLRFRADSRINAIIREVAAELAFGGVFLVDAERQLAESDAGQNLFHEHVHLTFAGNYVLARSMLDQVREALPQLAARPGQAAVPSRQRCADILAFTSWNEYQILSEMIDMTSKAPFTNQFDHRLRQAATCRRRDDLQKLASSPQGMQANWRTYQAALAKEPDDWSLHQHFGRLAMQVGRPDVAVVHLSFALSVLPGNALLHNNLGMALADQGQFYEAGVHFRKALDAKPDYAAAHYNLGNALANQGQVEDAISHFEKAIEINPDDVEAHSNLGAVLAGLGRIEDAIAHFQKAAKIEHGNAGVHYNLGVALAKRGRDEEAIAHFQEAVKIDPGVAQTHSRLGVALFRKGRIEASSACFEKALELDPSNLEFRRNLEMARSRQ